MPETASSNPARPYGDRPYADLLQLSTLTLATCGQGDGSPDAAQPHAAAVYFWASAALRLYFFSDLHSQHALDLAHSEQASGQASGQAAVCIQPETHGWRDIRGLQMRGRASRVKPGPEWETAWQGYSAKFPFVSAFKPVIARNELYVFIPAWARLTDNRLGFGYKKEWTFE